MSATITKLDTLSSKQRALLERRLQQRRQPDSLPLKSDDENLVLAKSTASVDELLSKFYGRFPWPWPAKKFDYLDDPYFETVMINQDIGDWAQKTLPENPHIWVAGCGTNQAIHMALRFRNGTVVASDVSAKSLEICARNAKAVGLTNLELKEESINDISYRYEFDYVACTGVIHHNADPRVTLKNLVVALKLDGILELMVYNRFHRLITSSFQKAIRVFSEDKDGVNFESEFSLAEKIVKSLAVKDSLERAFIQYMDFSESDFADLLIQPVEHSYTVESLEELAASCNLELLTPCISPYAKNLATFMWNLSFEDAELQEQYDAQADSRRWQITNLLLNEKSPLLWFYFQRTDSGRDRKTEKQICKEFLDTTFERTSTTQQSWIRSDDDIYKPSPTPLPYPMVSPNGPARKVFEVVDGQTVMKELLAQVGVNPTFSAVNELRTKLTTTAFPYLRAVHTNSH